METIVQFLKTGINELTSKYSNFRGVSSRYQYWSQSVCHTLIALPVLGFTRLAVNDVGPYGFIFMTPLLLLVIPGFAVQIRRLRDSGLSPWLLLCTLEPIGLGSFIIALVMGFRRTKNSINN